MLAREDTLSFHRLPKFWTHHIRTGILRRQHRSRLSRSHLKIRDDSHSLDLFGPRELDMMANSHGWIRRSRAGINPARRSREDLGQGDLNASHIFWRKRLEIGSHKPAVQCRANVVGVSF